MSTPHKIAATTLATVTTVALGALTAAPASATVMVSAPRQSMTTGHALQPGVWYRRWDGGPRDYRVTVTGPAGNVRLHRSGTAPQRWTGWKVPADAAGTWRTVYHVKDDHGVWHRAAYSTRVHH